MIDGYSRDDGNDRFTNSVANAPDNNVQLTHDG
jgi:hypothetical protein